jgi:peptidoglycan LD-endopeptidase LytH
MTIRRTTARGTLFLLVTALALVGSGTAAAAPAAGTHAVPSVPQLVFPVLGAATFVDDYGDARGQGRHDGNDIMAPRKAPVLAAEAGTVKFWTTSARAGCMLYLYGKSGTTYLYIHLNNDLGSGNDNRGSCVAGVAYAKGLRSGAKVVAGQVIGYNGDSGDADGGNPHLHFEVRPTGSSVNPYPHLKKARRLLFAAKPGTTFTLALTGRVATTAERRLALQLDQVRQWPGGLKVKQSGQKVAVDVPDTAAIEGADGPLDLARVTLATLARGSTVTVWTEPAKVTLAAQTGARGALAAERVVVKR